MNAFNFAMACPQCRGADAGCAGCSFKTVVVVDARVFLRNVAAAGALATATAGAVRRCRKCERGVIRGDEGDLPCACSAGDAALFYVSSDPSRPYTGRELRKLDEQRLALARQRRGTGTGSQPLGALARSPRLPRR